MAYYLLQYRQDKSKPTYLLFDEQGTRIIQNNNLSSLMFEAKRNNLSNISKDVPSALYELIRMSYMPQNNFHPVKGGSILELSLQDNDQNLEHLSE